MQLDSLLGPWPPAGFIKCSLVLEIFYEHQRCEVPQAAKPDQDLSFDFWLVASVHSVTTVQPVQDQACVVRRSKIHCERTVLSSSALHADYI